MTIDLESLASINASPLPYDLFRETHKGLRRAIFGVIEQAGRADYASEVDRLAVLVRVDRLIGLLRDHERHEVTHTGPFITRHASRIAGMLDESHAELDGQLRDLHHAAAGLAALGGCDAVGRGLDLYRRLAAFAAISLVHMAFEEGVVMTALRDAMNIGELHSLDRALRESSPPDGLCDFMADLGPALNMDERTAFLAAVRRTAPQLFERMRAALESALCAAEYQVVAARLDVGAHGEAGL